MFVDTFVFGLTNGLELEFRMEERLSKLAVKLPMNKLNINLNINFNRNVEVKDDRITPISFI